MYILGINAAFHDSAAVLLKDGQIIAAAEDERFTHIKHGKRPIPFSSYELPYHAINYCLNEAGIHLNDIHQFAYSFDPTLINNELKGEQTIYGEWDLLFSNYLKQAPLQLTDGYPHHLQKNFVDALPLQNKWHFVQHHIAHAASAFFPSPFNSAAVLTIDGRGEKVSTGYYYGEGNKLTTIAEVQMPHSLGMLYEKITTYLGFLHSSDEYKVMALASYGKPIYLSELQSWIKFYETDGTYTIDNIDLESVWGKGRKKDDTFDEIHFNIAHSLQKVLEETVLKLVYWLYEKTHSENLCLAGGVALNCVSNSYIRDKGPFKNVWVQPAAGDAGTALGAAMWVASQQEEFRQADIKTFAPMDHVYYGPEYTDDEIEKFLKWTKVKYRKLKDVATETAEILAQNKVIGWYQGRMEYGPRALGSRSILASPIDPGMQAKLNEIKDREDFRPVAPVVLEEDAADWFEDAIISPYMLFVFNVKPDKADKIPAVRHVDGTARVQTINREQHAVYYDLLKAFKNITGVPVLVNTSFNTRGEPIVCTPRDAIECFWTSPFDALVINSFLLEK